MAFTMTNKQFASREAAWLPVCHQEIADQTLVAGSKAVTTVNTGIVGLQWIRVRALLKTINGITAGERFRVTVIAGTGAAITGPTQILQKSMELSTGATEGAILLEDLGWSNAGFQSYSVVLEVLDVGGVTPAADVTSVIDLMVDCA